MERIGVATIPVVLRAKGVEGTVDAEGRTRLLVGVTRDGVRLVGLLSVVSRNEGVTLRPDNIFRLVAMGERRLNGVCGNVSQCVVVSVILF